MRAGIMRPMSRFPSLVAILVALPSHALDLGGKWTKSETRNVIVYSNARDFTTEAIVSNIERMRANWGHPNWGQAFDLAIHRGSGPILRNIFAPSAGTAVNTNLGSAAGTRTPRRRAVRTAQRSVGQLLPASSLPSGGATNELPRNGKSPYSPWSARRAATIEA